MESITVVFSFRWSLRSLLESLSSSFSQEIKNSLRLRCKLHNLTMRSHRRINDKDQPMISFSFIFVLFLILQLAQSQLIMQFMLGDVPLRPTLGGVLELDSKATIGSSLMVPFPLRIKAGGELSGNSFINHSFYLNFILIYGFPSSVSKSRKWCNGGEKLEI